MRTLIFVAYLSFAAFQAISQANVTEKAIEKKMQWFADAKLGIFIHTGIYAVNGIDESWSFHNRKISHADYMKQLKGFNLKSYDPAAWADLINESGARYSVITTKHHDGVAMYDTKLSKLSSVRATPSKLDMIKPFFEELRKRGLKCGAYFSLIDWTHSDYPGFLNDSAKYRVADDYDRWNRFRKFCQGQISEVSRNYKPDIMWFDGDWEHSAEEWEAQKIRKELINDNPDVIINGRLQGYGDYETPEQNFPVSRPSYRWWELCMTINNSWGYQGRDTNWKTPYEIITIFVDVVANGGNLLLDIGPKADGTIPSEQVQVLRELGKWNKKHGEAIFNTIPGLPQGHYYGPSTMSKDSTTLYLFVHGGVSGKLMVKGLRNKIDHISVLGSGTSLDHKIVGKISWSHVPGLVYIDLPKDVQDQYVTVMKLELDAPLSLYRGKGGFD